MNQKIVILGSGPAAYTAAIRAAQANLSVTVVQGPAVSKRLPGETLHPGIEPLLKQLDVWDDFSACVRYRHTGIWHETHDGDRSWKAYGQDEHGPWSGFQVQRTAFHELLKRKAIASGAEIIEVASLRGLSFSQDGSLHIDAKALPCRFLLDGTGRRAWLAEHLGLQPTYAGPAQRIRFGWHKKSDPSLKGQPLFQQASNGWDWFAPLGDSETAWVRLRYGDDPSLGADYTCRYYPGCAGDGYFFLGDAAALLDPSAANGVLRSLLSASYVVHLIREVLLGIRSPSAATTQYQGWIQQLFETTHSAVNAARRLNDPEQGFAPT